MPAEESVTAVCKATRIDRDTEEPHEGAYLALARLAVLLEPQNLHGDLVAFVAQARRTLPGHVQGFGALVGALDEVRWAMPPRRADPGPPADEFWSLVRVQLVSRVLGADLRNAAEALARLVERQTSIQTAAAPSGPDLHDAGEAQKALAKIADWMTAVSAQEGHVGERIEALHRELLPLRVAGPPRASRAGVVSTLLLAAASLLALGGALAALATLAGVLS